MKTLRLFLLPLLFAALALTSFKAATASDGREVRQVSPFTSVTLAGSVAVVIKQGSTQLVEIEGLASDLAQLETAVKNNRLRIGAKPGLKNVRFQKPVTVYVTMPAIEGLSVSGSGRMQVITACQAQKLMLAVSGSGRLVVPQVQAAEVHSSLSGSGDIRLAGNSPKHDASISGSGDIDASELKTEASSVSISGSGDFRLHATRSLKASIMGSGDVYVKGNPPQIDSTVMGSGRVHKG
ncbi:DUF2807 domain-containing protein [Hymenobacter sp. BT175]|uniref:head GIN domain-containing protein n=1 Tax=Hymenobacter translucens TaxID=2886507 RepID=UPI001D0EA740|nr:head GIN domain-containing protein [Hymenobacter translucens]MCC2545982.1 DUF2807 domain-containing protein [Hymenobacter translucens]